MKVKNQKRLGIALICGCALLLLSCGKEGRNGSGGIQFRASSHSTETKTSYSGVRTGTFERIDWVVGDLIRIYSPQATGTTADYSISTVTDDGRYSVATIGPTNGSLFWDEGAGIHRFYCVYPSLSTTGMSGNVSIGPGASEGTVSATCTIPSSQVLSWDSSSGDVIGAPDMRYAYMYASVSSSYSPSVELDFDPKFTAFQIEVGAPNYDVAVSAVGLTSTGSAVTGVFTISGMQGSETVNCSAATGMAISSTVEQTLTQGHTLIYSFLALPQTLTGLVLTFTFTDTGGATTTRKLSLKDSGGNFLSFAPGKKYTISGVSFPKISTMDAGGEEMIWQGSVTVTDLATGQNMEWVGEPVAPTLTAGATGEGGMWQEGPYIMEIPDLTIGTRSCAVGYNITELDGGPLFAGEHTIVSAVSSNNGRLRVDGWDESGHVIYVTGITPGEFTIAARVNVQGEECTAKGTITVVSTPPGALPGRFTINGSDLKVYFSQGNLQCCPYPDGGEKVFRFANKQYDFVGNPHEGLPRVSSYTVENYAGTELSSSVSPKATATYGGWIDLFGFGTSGDTYFPEPYTRAEVVFDAGMYALGPTYYDWGLKNVIYLPDGNHQGVTTGDAGIWRTLTGGGDLYKNEWYYLLKTRSASTIGSIDNARYAFATINIGPKEVFGLILFPDQFALPTTLMGTYDWTTINSLAASSIGVLSKTDWEMLETVGLVFLPMAGSFDMTVLDYSTISIAQVGTYWSRSYGDVSAQTVPFHLEFLPDYADPSAIKGQLVVLAQGVGTADVWKKAMAVREVQEIH